MRHFSEVTSGISLLMDDELEKIYGGNGQDTDETIEVRGHHHDKGFDYLIGNTQDYAGGFASFIDDGRDESVMVVSVQVNRDLSRAEREALEDLKNTLHQIGERLSALPDNSHYTLPNGQQVTGHEIKDLWAKLDINITDNKTFNNGSQRSEADYNNGNPTVNINIQEIQNYHNTGAPGALEYVALHELGHMTAAGQSANIQFNHDHSQSSNDASERLANDVAAAVGDTIGVPVYAYADGGFSHRGERFQ